MSKLDFFKAAMAGILLGGTGGGTTSPKAPHRRSKSKPADVLHRRGRNRAARAMRQKQRRMGK